MRDPEMISRYLCMSADVIGYGGDKDFRQADVQDELIRLMLNASDATHRDRTRWLRQAKGDNAGNLPADSHITYHDGV